MTVLLLENDKIKSCFFIKLLHEYSIPYRYIDNIKYLEDEFYHLSEKNFIFLSNASVDNRDMFSYLSYLKRKHNLLVSILIYSDKDIIKNAIRAKKFNITEFFALPVLPYELIDVIKNIHLFYGYQNLEFSNSLAVGNCFQDNLDAISVLLKKNLDAYYSKHTDSIPSLKVYDKIMHEVEAQIIRSSLQYTKGNRLKAADILGINRNTLRKKMQQYNILSFDMLA